MRFLSVTCILSAALLSECFMPRFRFFLMSPLKILLVAGFFFAAAGLIGVPAAEAAKAMLLMDASSGRILYSQNADRRIAPASLTKVMSMFLALDAVKTKKTSLSKKVKVSRRAAAQGGSRMGLKRGERVSLHRLLMGMAVSSGNDASMAVAEHIAGSGEKFVRLMNRKARQLGMRSTTFKTPNGLPARGQVTTARDMGKLARAYLRAHPSSLQKYHRVKVLRHNGAVTRNKNPLLGTCSGADGLKTGWVTASGYNIISTVRRGKTRLIAVVLGADSGAARSQEVRKLVEAGFTAKKRGVSVASVLSGKAQAGKKQSGKIARKSSAQAATSRQTVVRSQERRVQVEKASRNRQTAARHAPARS